MIVAMLLAAAPANFPPAERATIAHIYADPMAWDARWVRLQGWVDSCNRLSCRLYEGPRKAGLSLSFEAIETFDEWLKPQLPAEIEVTAYVDATCIRGVCTDRAPELRRMHAESIRPNANVIYKEP